MAEGKFINGKRYVLQVAMIHTYNPDGTPKLIGLLRDNDIVNLAGGEAFMTLLIPEDMTKPKDRKPKHDNSN